MKGAVLGFPISHSLSPVLHQAAYKFLEIEGSYSAIAVHSGELNSWFAENSNEYDYFSLTMPLKEEVIALTFEADDVVQRTQSANTLYKRDSAWKLTSTDGSGFISAISHAGINTIENVLVLGAGGTARAVVGALDGVASKITVLGRTSTRRESLENSLLKSSFSYQRWDDDCDFSQYQLVVNTTPAGAADLLANSARPGEVTTLFDVIYKPWPTVLASRWADCGGQVINGLELLLYQGIHQLEYALGRSLDEETLATYLRPILAAAAR